MTRLEQALIALDKAVLTKDDYDPNDHFEVGFFKGVRWADDDLVEKACKWLEDNCTDYEDFINDFRNAMEEYIW